MVFKSVEFTLVMCNHCLIKFLIKNIEASAISSSFLDVLKLTRTSIVTKPKLAKKKLVNIPAGKSLSHLELLDLKLGSNKSIPN